MRQYALKRNRYVQHYSLVDAVLKTLYLTAASLICFYSALWMIQDIFPDWEMAAKAQVWANMLIFIMAALYEIGIRALPRYQMCCCLSVPMICGIILFRYAKENQIELEDGACAFVSQFLEKYNKHLKTSFSIWKGKPELIGMSFSFWCICIAAVMLILVLITGWRIFLLIMPAAVLSAEILIGFIPQWRGLALFLVGVMIVFAAGDDNRRKILRASVDGRLRTGHSWYQKWLPVICLAGGGVLLMLLGGPLFETSAGRLMEQAPVVQDFQRKTEQNLGFAIRSIITQRKENIGNRSPKYTGKEVMKVSASAKPETDVYLKGFYGTDYVNGVWVCDKQKFEEACIKEGMQLDEAAEQLMQTPYDVFSSGPPWYVQGEFSFDYKPEYEEITYTIEHTGIHDRYAYLPYFINYMEGSSTERLIGDVTVQKGWGQKKFTYRGWNREVGHGAIIRMPDQPDQEIFRWYDAFAQHTYLGLSDHVSGMEEYLNSLDIINKPRYAYGNGGEVEIDLFAGLSVKRMIFMMQDFREKMELYNDDALVLNENRMSMAFYISSILNQYLTYSLNLDPISSGMDAVDYFLTQSHKGYCVHFASAAVLMMREMGIPARYVSGYVARKDDFKYVSSRGVYEASVKDSSAHAWVEIYLAQIGWVPLDVTPGQEEQAAAAQKNAADLGFQTSTDDISHKKDDTKTDDTLLDEEDTKADETNADETDMDDTGIEDSAEGDSNHDNGKQHNLQMEYWIGLLSKAVQVIAAISAILLAYLMIRYFLRSYQEILKKELKYGKYRRSVVRMNKRVYRKLLCRGKIRRRNMTDADYEHVLNTVFVDIGSQKWKHYMQILKEAAFSEKELNQEDAYFCYQIYCKICRF